MVSVGRNKGVDYAHDCAGDSETNVETNKRAEQDHRCRVLSGGVVCWLRISEVEIREERGQHYEQGSRLAGNSAQA